MQAYIYCLIYTRLSELISFSWLVSFTTPDRQAKRNYM